MTKYFVGIVGSAITALIGGWLILSPWVLSYQPAGRPWIPATKEDLWMGIGVAFVSLVGLAAYSLGLVGGMRSRGVLPERPKRPRPVERPAPEQPATLEQTLAPLIQALLEDREARRREDREVPTERAGAQPEWRYATHPDETEDDRR